MDLVKIFYQVTLLEFYLIYTASIMQGEGN